MNAGEEVAAFRHELGMAIGQWGYVEGQLLRIATGCVGLSERNVVAVAYHSVENFRSKLTTCDNLVRHTFKKSPYLQRWHDAMEKTKTLSTKRNKIVHGWHKLYVNNAIGRRWAIIPYQQESGELIHSDGETPPPGAICLRDLADIHQEFRALTTQLCNVNELLSGRRAPFPIADEKVSGLPTVQSIRAQIRAALGCARPPSRQKS